MSTPITPLADGVVAVREVAEPRTVSCLYLEDAAKEKPTFAVVQAVGQEVKKLRTSDKIKFKEFSTTELKINGTEYLLV